jgi:hypothetical protein
VRIQATDRSTTTDQRGRFRLAAERGARITAAKEGFLITSADWIGAPLTLRLRRLPPDDNEAYQWVDPTPRRGDAHNCGSCHGEIYREWAASAHARSATGLHFRNLYEGTDRHGRPGASWGLLNEHPDGSGVCAACHAPALPAGDPARFDLRAVSGVAARGVHCDFCHKVAGVGDGAIGLSHGAFNLELLRPRHGQLFFGPLDDVDRGEDAYSPLYRDSRYCASCHEGTVFGVPVYTTWSEWLESPARREGRHCQDCHTRPTGRLTNIAPGRGGRPRDPRTLGNHRFFDGSQEEMLRRCLRVAVQPARRQDGIRVAVGLTADGVGHCVPTGFIDRQLLLVAEATDAAGQPVAPRAGPLLPSAAGDLAGKPGRLFARQLTDLDGNAPAPFWRPSRSLADTRLRPGQPVLTEFVLPPRAERLRVRLLYRRFWHAVARAKDWNEPDLCVYDRTSMLMNIPEQPAQPARAAAN